MKQSTLRVSPQPNLARGPSPTLDFRHRLQVPKLRRDVGSNAEESKYNWGEEEIELIRTCAILSSSLGLSKSLSTSDITMNGGNNLMRLWVSEENLNGDRMEAMFPQKLEPMSRSCSTWVAVGDVVSSSQLPSPQARLGGSDSPAITAVDFIRSVNKKVRQNYIRKRLEMSYRVLKRLTEHCQSQESANMRALSLFPLLPSSSCPPQEVLSLLRREVADLPPASCTTVGPSVSLTTRDIERDRGRPLTRFERNMIIFNWLQTLEGESYENIN